VFALPSGERLHQFRRGSYPATIHSLVFSPDASLLVVSSESDTVHVFRLEDPAAAAAAYVPAMAHVGAGVSVCVCVCACLFVFVCVFVGVCVGVCVMMTRAHLGGRAANSWSAYLPLSYLPTVVTDTLLVARHYAWARLPALGPRAYEPHIHTVHGSTDA
jgi:hypothetical protein